MGSQIRIGWRFLEKGGGGPAGEAQQMAIYLVPRFCDWSFQFMAEYFGLMSYDGASWVCANICRRRET